MPTQAGTAQGPRSVDGARRRGRPSRYTREQIARVALELVDLEGLQALTMQRLARELDAGTMTLYGYFENREDLLDAVVDVAVESARWPTARDEDWRHQVTSTVKAVSRTLASHPALLEIRARRPVLRPEALRFAERVIGLLREAGFGPEEAASGFRLIFTYTFGFAILSPQRSRDGARRAAAVAAAGLPPEEYPNLTVHAREWTEAMAGTEQFDYGLERLLDGLAARLPAKGAP